MLRQILLCFAFATIAGAAEFKVEKDVVYGSPGGKPLRLDVYRPTRPAAKARPAIVLIHGGGWFRGDKKELRRTAELGATAGFVAFSVNYRLAGSPKTAWPAQLDDVQRAVRWVRANAALYGVDPDRIGAIGESAGGHLVSFLGTTDTRDNSDPALAVYSSRVRCVVDMYGPQILVDEEAVKSPDIKKSEGYSLVARLIGAKPEENVQVLREASPVWRVNAKSSPFLIFHGGRDQRVPVLQSELMDAALRQAGVESRLIIFADEGHGFGKKENVQRFHDETFEFFKRHLGN